jgi:hypothetical protein
MADNSQKTPMFQMLSNILSARVKDHLQNQPKNVPCHVTKVDGEFVYVAPDVKSNTFTFPTIRVPQTYSTYNREPTQVGDKGYIVAGDYYLGGETDFGGGQSSLYPRGNLTPLAFQPVSSKDFNSRNVNQNYLKGGPAGFHVETADGKTFIDIDQNGKITIQNQDNSHVMTFDQANKKITIKVPTDGLSFIYLGGDGVTGTYSPVSTTGGPCINVMGRIG